MTDSDRRPTAMRAAKPPTMIERAVAILHDPEQTTVHAEVAPGLAVLLVGAADDRRAAHVARMIVHVTHEATYAPPE